MAFGEGASLDGNVALQFYSNNVQFSPVITAANFRATACPGIEAYTLVDGVNAGLISDDQVQIQWPLLTATSGSGSGWPYQVNGYYVISFLDGTLLWCQRFETPWWWWAAGESMAIYPVFGFCMCHAEPFVPPREDCPCLLAGDGQTKLTAGNGATILEWK
jgi:hypothetical protein